MEKIEVIEYVQCAMCSEKLTINSMLSYSNEVFNFDQFKRCFGRIMNNSLNLTRVSFSICGYSHDIIADRLNAIVFQLVTERTR